MIKGVNKKIIEISHPKSTYFEKAVFYLKPDVLFFPDEVPESELDGLNFEDYFRKSKKYGLVRSFFMIFMLVLFFLLGIFIGMYGQS